MCFRRVVLEGSLEGGGGIFRVGYFELSLLLLVLLTQAKRWLKNAVDDPFLFAGTHNKVVLVF